MTETLWIQEFQDLWQRIEQHPLQSDGPLDFHRRLCREQGWSLPYGLKVLNEYRRFVFLSCVQSQSLTPSIDVDETWHLHLTYTEDYWLRFCPQVLRRPLHHRPTTGTSSDRHLYREQYAMTLQIYYAWFGSPDPEIWPSARARFLQPARFQKIDRERFWVIPKPRIGFE